MEKLVSQLDIKPHTRHDSEPQSPVTSSVAHDWSPEVERKLLRKFDRYFIPTVWLMSLLCWMDRANLGNASIAGLITDLSLTSSQFSFSIIIMYFGLIAWAPIASLLLPRIRPSLYLPGMMFLWGVVTAVMGAVKTYPQLCALRFLVGIFESGFTPAVSFVFSCWYRRDEIGKRMSLYLTSAMMGGAFGGLIAGGVMENLEGAAGIRGWRWLFIVEGAVTMAAALLAMWTLPDLPRNWKRLTEEERGVALARLRAVGVVGNEEPGTSGAASLGIRRSVVRALKDWKTWGIAVAGCFMSATLIMAYFYPVLVRGLGYTKVTTAQYMTVPIWAVGFVFALTAGFVADRAPHNRALLVTGCLLLMMITAIITCVVYDFKARYVLLSFMTGGLWGGFTQTASYIAELIQDFDHQARAIALAIMTMATVSGNIYGAYLFPAEHSPKYLLGFGVVSATAGLSAGVIFLMWIKERREKRDL
ncbi:major facilitator superfamily domain-containing protein [Cladorrhinum sp. PSN332]|nr:major facilitator superfamily domain-containing protein [Cladorrhinum sp. PSN332]